MIDITLTFNDFLNHRMPQYSMHNCDFPMPQEEENEIWLRIPVKLSNEHYSLEFFIQSKIYIEKIKDLGRPEDVTYFLTTQSFPKKISKLTSWDVLSMLDHYPLYDLNSENLKNEIPSTPPHEYQIDITSEFHEYLIGTYAKISKANEALEICKENLEQMVSSSTASGFSYIQGEIRHYLNFLRTCSHNLSDHSHNTYYFRKNLRKVEHGFEELIKRKQVSNWNYQHHLEETRTALYSLSRPDVWDGRIPEPPKLLN